MQPDTDTSPLLPLLSLPHPGGQRCPFARVPAFAPLNGHGKIPKVRCSSGIEAWLVTGYDDAREVLGASERFSTRCGQGAYVLTHTPPDAPVQDGEFVRMDGLPHRRFRRLIGPELSAAAAEQLRPDAWRIVDEQVDALAVAGAPADLCEQFARPVTVSMVARAFSLPEELQPAVSAAAAAFDADVTAEQMTAAQMPLFEYLYGLVLDPGTASGSGLLNRVIARAGRDAEPFTPAELVATAVIVIVAGMEATAAAISNACLALFAHPEPAAALRVCDPGSIPDAVEELLRHTGVNTALLRVAAQDTEIAGQPVREGEFVLVVPHTAGWDPSRFPDPGALDLARQPNPHLAFSHGPHSCPGQHLARLILQTVLSIVPQRLPTLRLAVPTDQIAFTTRATTRSPVSLPVLWDAVHDRVPGHTPTPRPGQGG